MFSIVTSRIRNKITALPVSIVALFAIASVIYFPETKRQQMNRLTGEQAIAASDLLAYGLGVALNADNFAAISEGYNTAKDMSAISYILIYDTDKNLLSSYNPDSVTVEQSRPSFDSLPVMKKGYVEKAAPIKFKDQAYGTVVVGLTLKAASDAARDELILIGVVATLFLLISVLVSLAVSSRIVAPLEQVRKAMRALGAGNLTDRCVVNTVDETAAMAAEVNTAMDALRDSISHVSSGAESISGAAEMLSGVSVEMARNAEDMAQRTRTVSSTVGDASASVGIMSSSADEMSGSIRSVAAAIEEMSASLNEVARNCQKESTIAGQANTQAQAAREVMEELGTAAREVAKIVEVINDIADQTNLLALNATIEAAGAGEAGKGFAVVAQEVKDLARQTATATDRIAAQIDAMQGKTTKAIATISAIGDVIEEINGISQSIVAAVEEQSVTVSEIAHTSSMASGNTTQISNSVGEWANGMGAIATDVAGVNAAAEMTAKGIDRIKGSAADLAKLSAELKDVVGAFQI